ncbi:hypothetical protein STVIR_7500 [Streptomyces viridochromogenes Tue57]|uniref:Low molecular weight protein antigen 6 PH domain-containing protein n=2 Tax=Streptomyces viridochromogenes TaxID=1938 RepID=L8P850_STRVR|nr:hypothetical protein STVIR_7500 [Streptomyces viridochromogenes Tue57]
MEDLIPVSQGAASSGRTWRISPLGRVFLVVVGLGVLAAVAADLDTMLRNGGVFVPVVLSAVSGAFFAASFRTSLTLTDHEVIIRNLGWTRTVPLATVTRVHAGYGGIEIETSQGRYVTAMAVQKANVSLWLGRRTRADDVAEAIQEAAARAVAGPSDAVGG